ncbi:MAG: pyridoxamine 5'-phosphate oxidase family protein [Egibacteraceae bacterium]
MASWEEIAAAQTAFADHVRRTFAVRKHATLATLRRDGSPRISGTEVEFDEDGWVYLGMMAGSVKAMDLRRDPRLALHCPTEDPPEDEPATWLGDGKFAGTATEVSDPDQADGAHRFQIDITEVVLTRVAPSADHLVIEAWHPDRGLERRERW